jgi:tetraprenyl-beta-curcumene synthase
MLRESSSCRPVLSLVSRSIPIRGDSSDPSPLSPGQVWALVAVAARELMWVIPRVAHEIGVWHRRALAIPDAPIREDALSALSSKRFNPEGAALFAVLPRRRDSGLVRLLVAYQVLLDFLDSASERRVPQSVADGMQLHVALVEALQPGGPISDYYRYHPWRDDGGYLRALVATCRECCAGLPSYGCVRPFALRGAERCGVQGLNHDPDPIRREERLKNWAEAEFAGESELGWWELTAAASSTLGVHALLAQAADPVCVERDVRDVDAAYMPWVCAASTMLDSYVDEAADVAGNGHSYVAHYSSPGMAKRRLYELVRRSIHEARGLRNGSRHALIVAGMAAMYLSADDARTPELRRTTGSFIQAGGSLMRLLLPILRLWRIAYAQRSA